MIYVWLLKALDFIVPSQREIQEFLDLIKLSKPKISYFKPVDAKTWGTSSST